MRAGRRNFRTRRGSMYVLMLGIATLVAVMAYGSIAVVRSQARASEMQSDIADAQLLVDANQSFSADEALAFLDTCYVHDLPIRLFEQPVPATDIGATTHAMDRVRPFYAEMGLTPPALPLPRPVMTSTSPARST